MIDLGNFLVFVGCVFLLLSLFNTAPLTQGKLSKAEEQKEARSWRQCLIGAGLILLAYILMLFKD